MNGSQWHKVRIKEIIIIVLLILWLLVGDHAIKNEELQLKNKVPEAQRIIQQGKGKFAPKKRRCFTLHEQIKKLQDMMHTLQRNLANAQFGSPSKLLKIYKVKEVASKEACSARENPIYYALGQRMPYGGSNVTNITIHIDISK